MGLNKPRPLPPVPKTIQSLRLNLEEARAGHIWLLLPDGYRERNCGIGYPLPTSMEDLRAIANLRIGRGQRSAGAFYIRRARKMITDSIDSKTEPMEIEERAHEVALAHGRFKDKVKDARYDISKAVAEVKKFADEATSSMNDLFELGRRGMKAQMEAHLNNEELHGEKIDARAFRECFRMVSQTVKGLGLPSHERDKATEAILDEFAASMKARDAALAMAPGNDDSEEKVN